MKKYFYLLFVCLGLFWGGAVLAQEAINDFSVTINVNPDASLDVSESITYDFGIGQKPGFSRDIPFKYRARGQKYNLKLSDFAVTNAAGEAFAFTVQSEDGHKNIRIGGAAGYVTGEISYIISYRVKGAISRNSGQDEFYWDVTGNAWGVPIRQSRANVVLPRDSAEESTRAECFAGPLGSTAKCVSYRYKYSGEKLVNSLIFTDDYLEPGQGFAIAVGFAKGVIEARSWPGMIFAVLVSKWTRLVAIIIFGIYIFYRRSRKTGFIKKVFNNKRDI